MKLSFWLVALLIALSQTACNTVEGVGEDVEAAGEAVQDIGDDDEE